MYLIVVTPAPSQLKNKLAQSPYLAGVTHQTAPAVDHLQHYLKPEQSLSVNPKYKANHINLLLVNQNP